MKSILIVDDNEFFLGNLRDGLDLEEHGVRGLFVTSAEEALELLAREPIDLLVTDMRMPGMGGLGLLAHVSRHHQGVPTIVMTAYSSLKILEQLSQHTASRFIEKPLDLDRLQAFILQMLYELPRGHLSGVPVTSLLQLLDLEGKSCTLRVTSQGQVGLIHVNGGEIVGAQGNGVDDLAAIHQILSWPAAEIHLERLQHSDSDAPRRSVQQVLLDYLRQRDELEKTSPMGMNPGETVDRILNSKA